MIILCFGMIFVMIYMNKILWEKLKNNNVSLTNKLNSMFNAMKTPLISLNYRKNQINFNLSFNQFLKDNFSKDDLGIKFLLDEIKEEQLDNSYLSSLTQNISNEDLNFLEKELLIEKNQVKNNNLMTKKFRILILNKIFSEFISETDFNKSQVFNIFDLIKSDKIFKEFFEVIGEYKFKFQRKDF